MQPHLNGFSGYAQTIGCADEDRLTYTLGRIQQVSFVIGCIIHPGLDEGGETLDCLLDFVWSRLTPHRTGRLRLAMLSSAPVNATGQPHRT
jgi:hypothetical protein